MRPGSQRRQGPAVVRRRAGPARPEPRRGQLWTTRIRGIRYPGHERDGELSVFDLQAFPHEVVILEVGAPVAGFQVLRVAPVSLALEMAMPEQGDVVVEDSKSPTGLPFMIEVWNEQSMLAENLEVCLGELGPEVMAEVESMRGRHGALSYGDVVLRGLDGDPKWRFRAEEYEETVYLREPVEAAYALAQEPVGAGIWGKVVAWIGGLVERGLEVMLGPWTPVQPPAAVLAAAGPGEERVWAEAQAGPLRVRVTVGADEAVWVRVETEDAALEGKGVRVRLGEEEVKMQIRRRPGGLYDEGLVGRVSHLRLGAEPFLAVAVVEEASEDGR